jgi:hypothetical protein
MQAWTEPIKSKLKITGMANNPVIVFYVKAGVELLSTPA